MEWAGNGFFEFLHEVFVPYTIKLWNNHKRSTASAERRGDESMKMLLWGKCPLRNTN